MFLHDPSTPARRTSRRLAAVLLTVSALLLPGPGVAAASAADLYVYGHSWTQGYGLRDTADRYPRLVADAYGLRLHSRGVNGSQVHQTLDRVLGSRGPGRGTWRSGTRGVVLVQATLNTLRDFGADPRAVATARNALRTVLATVNSARRIEESARSFRFGGGRWRRPHGLVVASGGAWRSATERRAFVQFRAAGGEYVALRARAGYGPVVAVWDRTTGRRLGRVNLSRQVHPAYDGGTRSIGYVYRVPRRAAGHVVRLTKVRGHGSLAVDVRLPQLASPNRVILVKEPYLPDWSLSRVHPRGSNAAADAFNAVLDQVAAEFPRVRVVDPNTAGHWDGSRHLLADGTHPNAAGHVALMRTVRGGLTPLLRR